MSMWKVIRPGTQRAVAFVRGTKAEALGAVQRLATRTGQRLGLIPNPQRVPHPGEVWRGLRGDRCRIIKLVGNQVTVLQLDTGHRVTSHLSDFLATYKPPAAAAPSSRPNPKRGGRNPRRETSRVRQRGTRVTMAATPDERIAAIRRIVEEKQYAKVDGTMVDLFTASAIVTVYDALNPANKIKFASFPAGQMGLIAFKLLKKNPRGDVVGFRRGWRQAWAACLSGHAQANPPRLSRKIRRATAAGRFTKAQHLQARSTARGAARFEAGRRSSRRSPNPKGRKNPIGYKLAWQRTPGLAGSFRASTGIGDYYVNTHRSMTHAQTMSGASGPGKGPVHHYSATLNTYAPNAKGYHWTLLGEHRSMAAAKAAAQADWSARDEAMHPNRRTRSPKRRNPGSRFMAFDARNKLFWSGVATSRDEASMMAERSQAGKSDPPEPWRIVKVKAKKSERNPLPRWVDPRSVRSVRRGGVKVLVGCPKGKWRPRGKRGAQCQVGMRLVEVKRNPSPHSRDLEGAKRVYREWSELEPGSVTRVAAPTRVPAAMAKLGELVSLVYESDKYDGKRKFYEHETKRPRPVLAADPDGRHVFIVGGRMKPTADGLIN